MIAEAGLKDIRVETTTENLDFASGAHLWDWLVNGNPIPGEILAQLDLSERQTAVVREALEDMVRKRSGASGHAVLTSPINVGIATK